MDKTRVEKSRGEESKEGCGGKDRIRIRIRIVTGETPKRQSLTRTCD